MALHEKNNIRENILDDVYASANLSVKIPKYKFPNKEEHPSLNPYDK